MIGITYEVNGRRVSREEFQGDIMAEIMQTFGEEVQEVLAMCVCPVHGEQPSVTIKSTSDSSISYEVAACCDTLIALAQKKLDEIS